MSKRQRAFGDSSSARRNYSRHGFAFHAFPNAPVRSDNRRGLSRARDVTIDELFNRARDDGMRGRPGESASESGKKVDP